MSKCDDYNRLIKEVRKVDEEAATYLEEEAPLLDSFRYSRYIIDCFDWSQASQGHQYWWDIEKKIGQD